MKLYDEDGRAVVVRRVGFVGSGMYGRVYKTSDLKCLKLYRRGIELDPDTNILIKNLELDNFCKIYKILFDEKGRYKGNLMEYYQKEKVDVLTLPSEYLLDNLRGLATSVLKLLDNKVFISDMNLDNAIINENEIRVIDTDLYVRREEYKDDVLYRYGVSSLQGLMLSIYLDSLRKYHSSSRIVDDEIAIERLFETPFDVNHTSKKLVRCKYPIDYVMKCR